MVFKLNGKFTSLENYLNLLFLVKLMGDEKEIVWLVKLLQSKYTKRIIGTKSGCKRDFEVELCISENDKNFRKFLDVLIQTDILEFQNVYKTGKYYSLNRKKLIDRLNHEPIFILFKKAIDRNLLLY